MPAINITINMPQAIVNSIRNPTSLNHSTRAIADAMAHSTPAVVAAINSLPQEEEETAPRVLSEPNGYFITIRTLEGYSHPIEVHPAMTVLQIKEEMELLDGHPPDQQRLIFKGKQLEEDWRTCDDYCVKEGDVVHLVYRLRGS